jgi:hypothetical protein
MKELNTKYRYQTQTNSSRYIPVYFKKGAVKCTHTRANVSTYSHTRVHAHISIYVRVMQECNPFLIVNKIVTVVVQVLRQVVTKE